MPDGKTHKYVGITAGVGYAAFRAKEQTTVASDDADADFPTVVSELRAAMHEHIEALRKNALQRFARDHSQTPAQ